MEQYILRLFFDSPVNLFSKCPGDLVGSDVYRLPAMFWFQTALGTSLLVTCPLSI